MNEAGPPATCALLVDLDDTLLDDRGAMGDAVLLLRQRHALLPAVSDAVVAERWDRIGRSLWQRLALDELTMLQQRRLRVQMTFGLQRPDAELDALFSDYQQFYRQHWRAMPGADVFVRRTAGLPRAVVSNGPRAQVLAKLSAVGMDRAFTAVVTPDDCGLRKPQAGIFEHALRQLGVDAARALMVGDNLQADIAPARALGLRTFHVRPGVAGATLQDAADAV